MTSFKILRIKGGDVMTNDYKMSSSQKVGGGAGNQVTGQLSSPAHERE